MGGECPATVSLLVFCEDVRVTFSFEASMLPTGGMSCGLLQIRGFRFQTIFKQKCHAISGLKSIKHINDFTIKSNFICNTNILERVLLYIGLGLEPREKLNICQCGQKIYKSDMY